MAYRWYVDHKAPENVWIGTSVENQGQADQRIPALLRIPEKVRVLSMEPLLGPVDLEAFWGGERVYRGDGHSGFLDYRPLVHWVIVGGESGRNARPMHPDWARSLCDQCQEAGVPFFFKQWGEWKPCNSRSHN